MIAGSSHGLLDTSTVILLPHIDDFSGIDNLDVVAIPDPQIAKAD